MNTLLCNSDEAEKLPESVQVTVAASPPTPHLFEQMTNLNLHPVHVYGMTETYGPITKGYRMPSWDSLPLHEKYQKMARQGHGFVTSLPVRVIKTDVPEGTVVDVERSGKEIGEIVFIGNICARGYYKDYEATRKLLSGGVLHSGDLAVWHPDGAIQILDRAKDIIISGMITFPLYTDICIYLLTSIHRWREHFLRGPRVHARHTSRHPRSRCGVRPRFALGRAPQGICHSQVWQAGRGQGSDQLGPE